MSNVICTAYVVDKFEGEVLELRLLETDINNGVSIEDHIEWVTENMFIDDELLNIVIH